MPSKKFGPSAFEYDGDLRSRTIPDEREIRTPTNVARAKEEQVLAGSFDHGFPTIGLKSCRGFNFMAAVVQREYGPP